MEASLSEWDQRKRIPDSWLGCRRL